MKKNPFSDRVSSLSGPARDISPITPSDTTDLSKVAISLYVETGGTLVIMTVLGKKRFVEVDDFSILPVGAKRVYATGTTASGIYSMVLS